MLQVAVRKLISMELSAQERSVDLHERSDTFRALVRLSLGVY